MLHPLLLYVVHGESVHTSSLKEQTLRHSPSPELCLCLRVCACVAAQHMTASRIPPHWHVLINASAPRLQDGSTALLAASENGHTEVVARLLARDALAEINTKDKVSPTEPLPLLNLLLLPALLHFHGPPPLSQ